MLSTSASFEISKHSKIYKIIFPIPKVRLKLYFSSSFFVILVIKIHIKFGVFLSKDSTELEKILQKFELQISIRILNVYYLQLYPSDLSVL